jgi:hypothetical protein
MTLEAVLSDATKIPEGLKDHYVETDGVFVLDVPGMKTQQDFDNYATALKKRFTDAGADFARKNDAGLSRDDVAELIETGLKKFAPGVKPGDQSANGKGDDQVPGDVSARLHDLERNVASLTSDNKKLKNERDEALGKSRDTTIRNKLTQAANSAGATPEGVGNLVSLVEPNFEVAQDGSVVTKLEAGPGVSPNQKPDDYFAAIAREKAFRMFWPASKGAGADGEGPGGPGAGGELGASNPWSKAGWNLTAQGKLYNTNKTEAERLMKAVGVSLGATTPVR